MKSPLLVAVLFLCSLVAPAALAQGPTMGDSSALDFKQAGLLAIQDGGRRKPVDTFAREALTKITGRSTYKTQGGRKWKATDFVFSALLETYDWKNEPMVLVGSSDLKQKLGIDNNARRFSFQQLTTLPELQRLAGEVHALRRADKPLDDLQTEVSTVSERLTLLTRIMDGSAFLILPAATKVTDPWVVPPAYGDYYKAEQFEPVQTHLQAFAAAYVQGDSFAFSRAANQLRDSLRALSPQIYPTERELRIEYFYNHFDGFYRSAWAYGIGLVLLTIAHFRGGGRWWTWSGLLVTVAGLLFHATAITLRCIIAGRPPVTNMYESVIWVSFATALFGLIFYARYRTVIYLLAALPVALLSLLLVHQIPIAMPSSIDPLVPVLRDNFWLTIHVLTITLGYAAFALAMGFGHILLWRYAWNPAKARADQPMHFWLYRVLQLGVLLLAAGTILGGVWANYSWGRFWGWDPKETWALIALLSYILVLHGKLGGWWGQFGVAVGSVVCFLSILMAWYGVNFILGAGLHSYGFGIGGENYVYSFVALDMLFVGLAVWRYRASRKKAPAAQRAETEEPVAV